ncbi:MAG TPA: hypothetical protein VIG06_05730 [Kofleriaceae bacterium]
MKRAAVCLLVLAALAGPVRADHSDDQHITDEMPYTLRPGEWRVGLWKLERGFGVGPVDLQIGSYTWPYLLWLADLHLVNLYAKGTVWQHGPWSSTLGAGLVYLRIEGDEEEESRARFTIVPVEGTLGYRFGRHVTLAGGLVYTRVGVDGIYQPDDDDAFLRGAVAVDNLQVPITMEWRWSRVTALVLQARFLAFQDAAGDGHGHYQVDDATMVDVVASGETNALEPVESFALTTDFVWSWRHVNLRAGLTYGNVTIPMVNFVSPAKIVFPNVDLYVRF